MCYLHLAVRTKPSAARKIHYFALKYSTPTAIGTIPCAHARNWRRKTCLLMRLTTSPACALLEPMQPQKPTNQYLFSTSPEYPAKADAPHAGNPPFHARPMLTLAFGLLLGLYLGERFSLLYAAIAVLVLLLCALGARLTKRAMWSLFLLPWRRGFSELRLPSRGTTRPGRALGDGTVSNAGAVGTTEPTACTTNAALTGSIEGQAPFLRRVSTAPPTVRNSCDESVIPSSEKYKLTTGTVAFLPGVRRTAQACFRRNAPIFTAAAAAQGNGWRQDCRAVSK